MKPILSGKSILFAGLQGCLLSLALSAGGAQSSGAQEISGREAAGDVHLLAVAVCPPYRSSIPVEVCRNSARAITENLDGRMGIESQNIETLVDEDSTAGNFLATLEHYAERLQPNDRLIVYLLLHGDPFHLWANYYQPQGIVAELNKSFLDPQEDILVFWTEREPTVPALAIAQQQWLTASKVSAALGAIDADVALMLDSCSSSLFFQTLTRAIMAGGHIDYILTTAGSQQTAGMDQANTITLFAREFGNSIDLPYVTNFGQAVDRARMTTAMHAMAGCADAVLDADSFRQLYPQIPVPSVRTHKGEVAVPLWSCAQVPSVVDLSGKLSLMELYPDN